MIPNGVYLPFDDDNANIPAGWEEGTQFAGRCVFGAATDANGGTDGGSTTHTHNHVSHTHTFVSNVTTNTTTASIGSKATAFSIEAHPHASKNSNASTTASGTAANEPPNWEVIYITPSGADQDVPAGVIALFDEALPDGWSNYAALNNKFLKGVGAGGDAGDGGGSSNNHTHTTAHTHSNTTSNPGGRAFLGAVFLSRSTAAQAHTHSVAFGSSSSNIHNGNDSPTYRDLIAATAAGAETPVGLIGIFDGDVVDIPAGWVRVTLQDGKFLRADDAVDTGGSSQHTHTGNTGHNHSATDGNGASTVVDRTSPFYTVPTYDHSHT